jgi:hypothetical protein
VFTVQVYENFQYVMQRGGILLVKWRSSFPGSSDGKMDGQLACAQNTRYYGSTALSWALAAYSVS